MVFAKILLSWVFGKSADKGLEKIKRLLGHNGLQADFNKAAKEWAKNIPEDDYINPEVFFAPLDATDMETDRPRCAELGGILAKERLPSVQIWREAFMENWRIVKEVYKDSDPQGFFKLEESKASKYLLSLAELIYQTCAKYDDIFKIRNRSQKFFIKSSKC